MAVGKAGHRVRAISVVPRENEFSVGKPVHQQCQQADHQLSRRAMVARFRLVGLSITIRRDRQRQGHRPGRVWQVNQDRQDDPLVTVAVNRVRVRTATR